LLLNNQTKHANHLKKNVSSLKRKYWQKNNKNHFIKNLGVTMQ